MKKSIVMLALALAMGSTQAEAKTQVEEQVVSVGEFDNGKHRRGLFTGEHSLRGNP